MAKKSYETLIDEVLTRGLAEVIDRAHLKKRLVAGEKLKLKLGIDPTGAKLHLGHAVPLRALRRFQDFGHTVVLIIGDTTAMIGDPSGKNSTRPPLSRDEIAKNYKTYERQAFKILDKQKTEVRWQSEWYKKFGLDDIIREASKLSAGWVLSHETFKQRMKAGQPLAFHELLYPLLQAYDSVAVKPDVEFGGLDQKFNLLTGRELMKAHGLPSQDVVMTKYLIGTDGQKMGKSLNNFIALEEEPFEMFGKIMSMPDTVLHDYFELATDVPLADFKKMYWEGAEARNTKMFLARKIVEEYHGLAASNQALKRWNKFVSGEQELPGQSVRADLELDLRSALITTKIVSTKS
ncbi:MAG: tyrosine--tRNA ligase, partial [Candidatus Kerfeldbacteria bacterium]|nr:tyrosine--tRNA ligase [Candidatus Kerfeldbacteria bacterium]